MARSSALCLLTGRLDWKVAIVTGANSGIGKETTAELARRGAKVIMACRNKERAETALNWILDCYAEGEPKALTRSVANADVKKCITPVKPQQLVFEELDMASFASIRAFAQRILASETRIDFLINNAGIMACPYGETADGLELQIGTNHFGHFLLTELLMPAIKRAAPGSRIICLSSLAHKKGEIDTIDMNLRGKDYGRWKAYSQSKLANVIHARQLAQSHKEDGIIAVSVHPGMVKTDLYKGWLAVFRALSRPFMKSEWEGAQTTLYAVLAPDLENGGYYADCAPASISAQAQDDAICAKVWEMSCKTVGLDSPDY